MTPCYSGSIRPQTTTDEPTTSQAHDSSTTSHRSSQRDSKNSSPLSCSSVDVGSGAVNKKGTGAGYSKVHVNVLGKIKDRTGIPV